MNILTYKSAVGESSINAQQNGHSWCTSRPFGSHESLVFPELMIILGREISSGFVITANVKGIGKMSVLLLKLKLSLLVAYK